MTFEQPPRPRWGLRIALAAGCALVLALGVVTVSWALAPCEPGMSMEEDECVGVTFGSEVFAPELAPIEAKIEQENKDVEDDDIVATVGVLMPMTAGGGDSLSSKQIRHFLEGAYLAQRNANDSEGEGVKIRLALANEGRYERASEAVTGQLVDMAESENLRAVTGLGLSSPRTLDNASELAKAGIPMVGYLSADRFNSLANEGQAEIIGLTRVTPSLQQEISTIADHLKEVVDEPVRPVLVYDKNGRDLYTEDLRKNFEIEFAEELASNGNARKNYTGGEDAFGNSTTFGYIANQLCSDDSSKAPNVVLFAGRSNLLPEFVKKVRERLCPHTPITIVTGSESTDLELPEAPKDTSVSVVYASVSDPVALRSSESPGSSRFAEFETELESLPKPQPLPDETPKQKETVSNWSVMGHDTTITAITAIKRSVLGKKMLPDNQGVQDNLYLLHGPRDKVDGVSGSIELDSDSGDRINMNISILRRYVGSSLPEVVVTDPDSD